MRIGVVSDIHGSLDNLQKALTDMGRIDLLLHAGDGSRDLNRWRRTHDLPGLRMVAGNCDLDPDCPVEDEFDLGRWRVLLTHGHLYQAKNGLDLLWEHARAIRADLVIFGHTHRPEKIHRQGIILFNPGSLSQLRSYGRPSYGRIETTPAGLALYHVFL